MALVLPQPKQLLVLTEVPVRRETILHVFTTQHAEFAPLRDFGVDPVGNGFYLFGGGVEFERRDDFVWCVFCKGAPFVQEGEDTELGACKGISVVGRDNFAESFPCGAVCNDAE